MKVKTIITLALLITCVVGGAEEKRSHPAEQVHFSAEDDSVMKPVPLPKEVLDILSKDETVQAVMESESVQPENIPTSWFSASVIHLSTAAKSDLVVVGEPPVSGGNVALFWVFRVIDGGYDLVLKAPAHDLSVLHTRWKGYRDIELISMTASVMSSVVCRFNGQRYEGHRTKTETH